MTTMSEKQIFDSQEIADAISMYAKFLLDDTDNVCIKYNKDNGTLIFTTNMFVIQPSTDAVESIDNLLHEFYGVHDCSLNCNCNKLFNEVNNCLTNDGIQLVIYGNRQLKVIKIK